MNINAASIPQADNPQSLSQMTSSELAGQSSGIPNPQQHALKPDSSSSQFNIEHLRAVEKPTKTDAPSKTGKPSQTDTQSSNSPKIESIRFQQVKGQENEAIELRPLVIEQKNSLATNTFLEVAEPVDNFHIIDVYA